MPDHAGSDPLISLVVPCRDEASEIGNCLVSVLATEEAGGRIEIIVADGMSSDGTRTIIQNLQKKEPRLRLIDNPAKIVSSGMNAAIKAAQGQIIVRIDAHSHYAPDYISQCIATLQATGADNVGGPARTRANTYLGRAIAAAYHSPFSVGGARFHNPEYEGYVDTVPYGCWNKAAFEKFGLFDEELVRNQDDEHNLRIIRGGGKVYQTPGIKSWYTPRGSLGALFRQYMQYGYWKVRVIQKHKLPASWRHLVPGSFVLAAGLSLLLSVLSIVLSGFMPYALRGSIKMSCLAFPAVILPYVLALVVASIVTAARTRWKLLPLLPAVFVCYHFGYGYGFLRGIWDFGTGRRRPQAAFETLTR